MEKETLHNQGGRFSHHGAFVVNVNEKGRMTLPAKVRQLLNLPSEPSMVEMVIRSDGTVTIQGRLLTVAETAGAVAPLMPPKDWKEIETIVRDEVAERYSSESSQ